METQQFVVDDYVRQNGLIIKRRFFEAKSGKKIKNRRVLKKALLYCRKYNTLLIIATLDRLARNVFFIAKLIESEVDFVVATMPNANAIELLEQAIEDHKEGEKISKRTRECLQAAKRRGVELGKHGKVLAKQNKRAADEFALKMRPIVESIRSQGAVSVSGIAKALTQKGFKTYHGKRRWHRNSVYSLLTRIDKLNQ